MLTLATLGHLWQLRDMGFPIAQLNAQWLRIGNGGITVTTEPIKG